jgi:MFS family permease
MWSARFSGGGLSDRYGRRYIGLICAAMIAGGATAIFASNGSTPALAAAGYVAYGFGIGATIAIRSAAFSDVFGGHNFGAIFGIIAVAYPTGGIIVMNVGSIFYDRHGQLLAGLRRGHGVAPGLDPGARDRRPAPPRSPREACARPREASG